ncbi:hypothetical protein V6N13_030065 [Hibiscus sabdariffa]
MQGKKKLPLVYLVVILDKRTMKKNKEVILQLAVEQLNVEFGITALTCSNFNSQFQGRPGTPPVDELCDHFESYCYESHVAYAEMLRFTIGLISVVFPGFDVPVLPVVLPSDWLQRVIKLL